MNNSRQFNDLIVEQISYIYSIAYRMSGDWNNAEDITQETLMTALEKQSDLRSISALRSWLRRICMNIIFQNYRRNTIVEIESTDTVNEVIADSQISPEEEIQINESLREIQNSCFGYMATKLTVYQRAVFVLVEIFGVAIEETTALLQLSNGACKSHLHRARRNLNSFFSQYCQQLNPEKQCLCSCESWKQLLSNREVTKHELDKALIHPDYDDDGFLQKGNPVSLGKILYLFHRMPLLQPDKSWYRTIIKKIAPLLKKS